MSQSPLISKILIQNNHVLPQPAGRLFAQEKSRKHLTDTIDQQQKGRIGSQTVQNDLIKKYSSRIERKTDEKFGGN